MFSVIFRPHCDRAGEVEPQNFTEIGAEIESLALKNRVKGHGKTRRRSQDPGKPAVDVLTIPTKGAVFQLQIDRVEAAYLPTNILDMAVSEPSDPTVSAAQ